VQAPLPRIEDTRNSLKIAISDLEQQRRSYESQRDAHTHEMDAVSTSLVRLRVQFAEASAQYEFYRELQRYVENLATMFNVKVKIPMILSF
jgi:phage shock protein A